MRGKAKYAVTFVLVLALAVSMVPMIAAPAPAGAQGWPAMVGGATGWTWQWCYNTPMMDDCDGGQPYNTNSRNSIMVVFEDTFDLASISASNFKVDYTTKTSFGTVLNKWNQAVKSVEYHSWWDNEQWWGLAFLTLNEPMATDCNPTVRLVEGATVHDTAYPYDGIAPMLSIAVQGNPHAGGTVLVTLTASEPLDYAYLLLDIDSGGLPTVEWFPIYIDDPDDYGGYCGDPDRDGLWWGYECTDNTAEWDFSLEAADPQDTFYVEVLAHDNTSCNGYWWEHEKWTTESVFIQGKDTLVMHLWEGWNLISFPRMPVDPTLTGVFGDMGVTKVYTYENYRWYGATYDIQSGKWFTPTGLQGLSRVKPGLGYWVYCSPLGDWPESEWYWYFLTGLASQELGMQVYVNTVWNDLVVELEPAGTAGTVPPSYRLQKGWNLVGVPVMGSLDLMQMEYWGGAPTLTHVPMTTVSDFLSGVDWSALFWYLPTLTAYYEEPDDGDYTLIWPAGYHGTTPGTCNTPSWKVGFWMSAFSALGLPYNFDQPVELAGYEDYRGEFLADIVDDWFYGEFWGYTEYGYEFEGEMYGEIGWDGSVSGTVYGEIDRDDSDEYFYGTFTGWYLPMYGIPISGSFTGTTDRGNIIQGTYGGNLGFDSDFAGSVEGTIIPADAGLMETTVPVVMPGYGYWVYVNDAGNLVPVR